MKMREKVVHAIFDPISRKCPRFI